MTKTLICLVLSAVFAFLSFYSFMTNDYRPLQQWFAYYREYRAVEEALSRGGISPDDLRSHLDTLVRLYPGQDGELQQKLKTHYGDVLNQAQDTHNFLAGTLQDTINTLADPPDIDGVKEKAAQELQSRVSDVLSDSADLPAEDAEGESIDSFPSHEDDLNDAQSPRKNP